MIFFLYGPDTYRASQKLREIINQYKKIHKSGLNLRYIDCAKKSFNDFNDEIKQVSMFKEKKMLILTNSFSNPKFKEDFLKNGKSFFGSENIIVFYEEGEVSRKNSLFNFLKKQAKTQEFKFLRDAELRQWVKKETKKREVKIQGEAIEELVFFVGNNLWQMMNEIKKLTSFKAGEEIKVKDVQLLVRPKIELNIFKTIDAIAARDKKKALKLLNDHLEKGDSPFYLFSMINFQFRNLLLVKDIIDKNLSPFSLTGLHPFVVRKTRLLARRFSLLELKKIYQKIFEVDLAVKTGKIGAETALELLISEI